MSTTIETRTLVTPAELLAMPNGKDYELVDGELVERTVSMESSYVAGEIFGRLRDCCKPTGLAYVFPADLGYQCFPGHPNKVRKPDVSLILCERMPIEGLSAGYAPIPPDLAVEVVSPNDLAYEIEDKVAEYLDAGVRLVWVAYPPSRTVVVRRPDGTALHLGPDAELTGEGVVPGFRCRVGDLFPPMPAAPAGPAA